MESQHGGIKIVVGPRETVISDEVTLNGRNKSVQNSSKLQLSKSEIQVSADCSTRTESCQPPLKSYGQGGSRNETNIRPHSIEKITKVLGTPEIVLKCIDTKKYTTAAILVPCLSTPITHQNVKEKLKRTITNSYFKRPISQPKPLYVPGKWDASIRVSFRLPPHFGEKCYRPYCRQKFQNRIYFIGARYRYARCLRLVLSLAGLGLA